MEGADFWVDQEKANLLIKELKQIKNKIEPIKSIESEVQDVDVMIDLAAEDGGDSIRQEVEDLFKSLETKFDKFEFQLMLDGEYDKNSCYMSVHAGSGGTESCDWAQMLFRMYTRYAERNSYEPNIIDIQYEEEAGIKSVTLLIKGRWAYGFLKSEMGVHRLVRVSPFDAQNRRHTSFAAVDVFPEIDHDVGLDIDPKDLKIDTYRAGGAGGQHVNKTDSAVRILHIPSGVVVQCQNERSQHKNKAYAMKMLQAKLYLLRQKERDDELKGLKGEKSDIAWGRQIRSYVLHPYSMIKDHRTGMEVGNVNAVLDGEIEYFIEGYLKGNIKS